MLADPADLTGILAHCAATHDDTPRLVLADWLEDHDDFRAEFVRASVAFDRTPPYDSERFRLAGRLRELLASPPFQQWLPPQEGFEWGWRRGLLRLRAHAVNLEVADDEDAARLASNWIERVQFHDGHRPPWEGGFNLVRNAREVQFETDNCGADVLAHLREWPHLRALDISDLWGPWDGLAALPHLRALRLYPDSSMMPELHKARLPNLEVLDLNKEWNAELPHWGVCFPNLRSLTLTHYNTYPDEQVARFGACPHLRHLALYQRYQPFTRVGLTALTKMTGLRSLSIGPAPRGTLAGLAALARLERLGVESVNRPLRGLESLTTLRWLELEMETMTPALAAQVAALPQVSRLDLRVEGCAAGAIAALAAAPALRILTLSGPREHVPGAELARLDALRYLRLGVSKLAESDLLALRTALPACRLVHGWRDADDEGYDWS